MNSHNVDKEALKFVVAEIIMENPKYFKEIIREILLENKIIVDEEQAERRKRLEKMINEDFDKYDEVFQSLA
jgi:hypothetical protein